MKTLTAKKEARLEKKKKKSAALAQIIKLNDEDEKIKQKYNRLSSVSSSSNDGDNSSSDDNQRNKKKIKNKINYDNKNKNSNNKNLIEKELLEYEPKYKKIKLELNNLKSNEDKKMNNSIFTTSSETSIVHNNIEKDIKEQEIYIKERQAKQKRMERHGPKFSLKNLGECASLDVTLENRVPIFLTDIQQLIMTTLLGNNKSFFTPSRWYNLERYNKLTNSLVLIVEGISLFHFLEYESYFEQCNRIFNLKLDVLMPPHKEGQIIEELSSVPITINHRDELINKYGSLQAAIKILKDSSLLMKTLFPIDNKQQESSIIQPTINDQKQKISRTNLLLSAIQMVEDNYPLPLNGALANKYGDYIFTKDVYKTVTDKSPMYAVDCEMCLTITGGHELTRISIVDEQLKSIYDTLVRPTNKIIDYLTRYSGITPKMMINATKTLNEVQNEVKNILPSDAILIGQSLNSDLHAMRMMHPYVIDTSVIFNLTGDRRKKTKLQILAKRFLDESIQENNDGHDSLEDSCASMKLVQLKLANGIDFGDEVLKGVRRANEISLKAKEAAAAAASALNCEQSSLSQQQQQQNSEIANSLLNCMKINKRTAVITSQDIKSDLEKIIYKENVTVNTKRKSLKKNKKQNINNDNINNEINNKDNNKNDDNNIDNNKMNSSENIHFYKLDGNKATIRKTCEILHDYDLILSNLIIPEQRLEQTKIEKTITNIDKWIGKLWDTIAHRGLFIVLFGGAHGLSNGVAMIKIKKNLNSDSNNIETHVVT